MEQRPPLRGDNEAARRLVRPDGLGYPTPLPQQRQAAANGGLVHFEVSRHVGCPDAVHRADQRQHGQLIGTNTDWRERVVEQA